MKNDRTVAAEDRMLAKICVVAVGKVVAVVSAAALGASKRGMKNRVCDAAHGLRFGQSAAAHALLRELRKGGLALGLRVQTPAQ